MGSPPHTRGKVVLGACILSDNRITPAYTGKRTRIYKQKNKSKDHPRIHGEKSAFLLFFQSYQGSPPHTRGKVKSEAQLCIVPGITPAYTGKRYRKSYPQARRRDHPRIHGEKRVLLPPPEPAFGSPPHTRGKERPVDSAGSVEGITPAYTGKSYWFCYRSYQAREHPRIHGEK